MRQTTETPFPRHEKQFLCSFDDGPSGTSQTVVSSEPFDEQRTALIRGFNRAGTLLDTPREFFPESTVVPFAPETEQALQQRLNFAGGPFDITGAAQENALSTIRGDFLDPQNPALAALRDRVAGDVTNRVQSAFAGQPGAFGAPANVEALSRGLGDALAPLEFQNFQQERGNQLALLGQAPQFEQFGLLPSNVLAGVGAAGLRRARGSRPPCAGW